MKRQDEQSGELQQEILTRVDKVGETIADLARSMQVPAERLFEVLAMREFAQGVATMALLAVAPFVAWACYWVGKRFDDAGELDSATPCFAACVLSTVFTLIAWVACLPASVGRILAPEAYAFDHIMELLK